MRRAARHWRSTTPKHALGVVSVLAAEDITVDYMKNRSPSASSSHHRAVSPPRLTGNSDDRRPLAFPIDHPGARSFCRVPVKDARAGAVQRHVVVSVERSSIGWAAELTALCQLHHSPVCLSRSSSPPKSCLRHRRTLVRNDRNQGRCRTKYSEPTASCH